MAQTKPGKRPRGDPRQGKLSSLSRVAFAILVCLAMNLALLWPWLSDHTHWSHLGVFLFFFALWAALVALAMLISKGHSLARPPGKDGP